MKIDVLVYSSGFGDRCHTGIYIPIFDAHIEYYDRLPTTLFIKNSFLKKDTLYLFTKRRILAVKEHKQNINNQIALLRK